MSKITSISYSRSYEIISPIGTIWEKIGIESELSENDFVEEELENLKVVVESFHQKSISEIPTQDTFTTVPGTKKDKRVPDLAVRVKYAKAASEMDEETIAKLESEYQF